MTTGARISIDRFSRRVRFSQAPSLFVAFLIHPSNRARETAGAGEVSEHDESRSSGAPDRRYIPAGDAASQQFVWPLSAD